MPKTALGRRVGIETGDDEASRLGWECGPTQLRAEVLTTGTVVHERLRQQLTVGDVGTLQAKPRLRRQDVERIRRHRALKRHTGSVASGDDVQTPRTQLVGRPLAGVP